MHGINPCWRVSAASEFARAHRLSPCTVRILRPLATAEQPRRRLKIDTREPLTLRGSIALFEKREERKNAERLAMLNAACKDILPFQQALQSHGKAPLTRVAPKTLQINIGKLCNLTCHHCHVDSGPTKVRENMDLRTVDRCIDLLRSSPSIDTVDITGGAPELNPNFRHLVTQARAMGKKVIDRCNLVVLYEKGQEDLADFLASTDVDVVASLPCYTEDNTDKQRGRNVFQDSITALQLLNSKGYGSSENSLRLDLVYNPLGPSLPGPQATLEADYRQQLFDNYGVTFSSLFVLCNMPIKRFADTLVGSGQYVPYMELLASAFNGTTVEGLMCRDTVNVAWDGKIYDCDFNAAVGIGSSESRGKETTNSGKEITIWNMDDVIALEGAKIRTGKHCYGCTAGAGSSCGGALV